MKIKKLEMVGFKSFVDRTVVHFDHEILGIVGPNGCGKSNIVDAIRWCMGEQSAKHLRGRAMEDVIFSGSESRIANDFAEVTLTFENPDGTDLPLEYRDYSEIAVTRRLHRNGDSDYLINKTPVRLKDITDLFLGTGVGTKAYSIVEQGKIGLIVSAKAEDRRILIEEAAGITKYKSKKRQAERKMELTQQNLLRVGDIVAEIERNLGSLKRQAAKAERYLAYRNELEDLQLHEASHRYLELVCWTKLETSEVERLTLECDEARSALAAREAELEGIRLEAHAAEEELEQAQNANFASENEVRAEEAAIDRARDKTEALKLRAEQAAGESHELEEQRTRLAHECEGVALEVASLAHEEAGHATQLSVEEERLSELCDEAQRAEKAAAELLQASSRAQAAIASAEAKLVGFERRRQETEDRLEKFRFEREELEGVEVEHAARAKNLERSVEDLRSGKVTSAEEKGRLEGLLTHLRTEITASDRALDDAKNEFTKKRSRLHALEEVQARLEGVGTGVKALVATKDETIAGLVADRIEAPQELTAALAGLLGNRLQEVVVHDRKRGLALLEEMQHDQRGRATIVPLQALFVAGTHGAVPEEPGVIARLAERLRFAPEDEALVRSLVGDALVVSDVGVGERLRQDGYLNPLVTLDGTVFFPDGRIAGGTGDDVAAGMLDAKREVRELNDEVRELEIVVSERLAVHQALRAQLVETQGALDRARHQAHANELALVTSEKDLRAAQTQRGQARLRLDALEIDIAELGARLEEADGERNEAQGQLEESRGALNDVSEKLIEAERVVASWREQVNERHDLVTEGKVKLAGARGKLVAAQGTLQRLERSMTELSERKQRLDDEMVAGAKAFGETAALLVLHKENLHLAIDRAQAASGHLAEKRSAYDAFRVALTEREAGLRDLRTRLDEVRSALNQHEMAFREYELAMDHLLGGVSEKFRGLRLARVVGDYHLRPPPDEEHRGRITELLTLIDRMGSVNLDAVREHEEAEKRFEFYSTQKADLEKALADLERAIAQMNRESRRLFEATFHAVNEKFREIFPRMFRGGRAELRLTNPDDLLETGIDIIAQPPGKKLASIELMSGGEKALTAVSLIFAIFQFKPSPFCILDEVDAPLDEANVARYNELVRSMTDRSQFILITHIKQTMQLVDVLYGVTMQEAGVSRLVSVKINDATTAREVAPKGALPAAAVA